MDEMKRLLIVGDSFMQRDPDFPGQHWSEMLPEYTVINHAQSGMSNAVIAYNLWQGLEHKPDAVILGWTMPDRLEFTCDWPTPYSHEPPYQWVSNGHVQNDPDRSMAVRYYQATTCSDMMEIKSYLMIRCCLVELQRQNIAFAFVLNGMSNNPAKPLHLWNHLMLDDFRKHEIPLNLATSGMFKSRPRYHVDSTEWQTGFAQHSRSILEKQFGQSI
jgi:hypothetical protein